MWRRAVLWALCGADVGALRARDSNRLQHTNTKPTTPNTTANTTTTTPSHRITPSKRKQGAITDMREERVVQPLLVTSSALALATECVRMILKIDDVVPTR